MNEPETPGVFRLMARDETEFWEGIAPLKPKKIWGIYLFKEGEATFCCSLTPSSWCVLLGNYFQFADEDYPQDAELQEKLSEYEDQNKGDGSYFSFIDVERTAAFVSAPIPDVTMWDEALSWLDESNVGQEMWSGRKIEAVHR